ncbi:MAG: hypothetical protein MUO99_07515, partial [Dehalococcoidales bacterium]|nr:hypothetical protein [Dehalococcoidales bacterium]
PSKLVLAYYDESAGKWKPLDTTVNTSNKTLSASTTHLSTWAVLGKTPSASTGVPPWLSIVIVLFAVLAVGMGLLLAVWQLAKPEHEIS